jgi:hypothetical protein
MLPAAARASSASASRSAGICSSRRICSREDEFHVLGGLFQRLQHGVERVAGKLVHLVDHVHLEAPLGRRVLRRLEELAHLVDARVGRCVDLQQVDEAPGVDLDAGGAPAAGRRGDARLAVEALGEDARERRLADAARAGEEIGVVQALRVERVAQRAHDVLLPDQAREILGAPLARKYLVAHRRRRVRGEPNPRHLQGPAVAASFRI